MTKRWSSKLHGETQLAGGAVGGNQVGRQSALVPEVCGLMRSRLHLDLSTFLPWSASVQKLDGSESAVG